MITPTLDDMYRESSPGVEHIEPKSEWGSRKGSRPRVRLDEVNLENLMFSRVEGSTGSRIHIILLGETAHCWALTNMKNPISFDDVNKELICFKCLRSVYKKQHGFPKR